MTLKNISHVIKQKRLSKDLTQKDLAKLMDTDQAHVSRLENPLYAKHSIETLRCIADVLEFDIKDFF
jgi:transcriptional regulator with XRE-family HTH domain